MFHITKFHGKDHRYIKTISLFLIMINVQKIKQEILKILNEKGPNLPIRLSKEIELSPIFTSAILSELVNERKVKVSNLKIGSSPLYLLPGQEQKLENFADNLAGTEKSAFLKLKQEKILEDKKQTPAIRVALRNIKDFSVPFKKDEEIFWRFHSVTEQEIRKMLEKPVKKEKLKPKTTQVSSKEIEKEPKEQQLDIGLNLIKPKTAKPTTKSGESFLEEVKSFLEKRDIKIIGLEEVDKRKVIAKININSQPYLLAAYNKKRVIEKEILKIYKTAEKFSIPYYIITREKPTKKISETMKAYKRLLKIDSFD